MKCLRCQAENDAGARFCEDCGARLETALLEGDHDRAGQHAQAVPREIMDEATGEMLDVIQDDDQRRSNGGCGS